jgi:hypothetical protein
MAIRSKRPAAVRQEAASAGGRLASRANIPVRIPTSSLSKAKAAFKNFSLSKFSGASAPPANLVQQGQQVAAVQERTQVNHLKSLDASGRKLRVALSDSDVKKLLPSFNGTTVDLAELLTLIQGTMRGTEFYCLGNPTLARLGVQSEADQIIQTVKQGADGGAPK